MVRKIQEADLKLTAAVLKSLAHHERLAILNLLCKAPNGQLTVKAIYENLGLQQSVVSRHLSILKNSGVVQRLPQGQKVYYCLCSQKRKMKSLLACFH